MNTTRLPELKERVSKDGDITDPAATQPDDSPRQEGSWDVIEGGLSAPPLAGGK